jgi:SAM-dependent methyltransferase
MQELKEYWNEAYSSSSTRVAYVSTAGKEITELKGRIHRNNELFNDFITHCQWRPSPFINELFTKSKTCLEVGCGTGEFLAGLMSITLLREGTGVDLSQAAIEYANANYSSLKEGQTITWAAGNIMDIECSLFDIVIANQVIEHFRDPVTIIKKLQEMGQYVLLLTPYRERVPEWEDDILDGSDNHLISVDESTYSEFEVLEDMVFFSKEGWGVSRERECPLQYAVLIKGTTPPVSWGTFK